MSYRMKMIIPTLGMLLIFGYAAAKVVNSDVVEIKKALPASLSNLTDVKLVEIKDANGRVILSGSFVTTPAKAGEIERKAIFNSTGVDTHATGEAEIEISTKNSVEEHELDVEVERLAAGTVFNLFVDNQEIAAFTTNNKGEAELEMSNQPSK